MNTPEKSQALTPKKNIFAKQAEGIIAQLQKKKITGYYFENCAAAVAHICRMIPEGSLVAMGGSETIKESGLLTALRGLNIRLLDRYRDGISTEEVNAMRRDGLLADIFISSTNAITADGKLVNIDGIGNRVAGIIYGPKKVIIITGMNKVAPNLDQAVSRIKNTAAPCNAIRVGAQTPCANAGFCQDPNCFPPHRICGQLVIIESNMIPDRLHVFLIGESLGY